MLGDHLVRQFERQAQACEELGSPFTARLCRLLPALVDEASATGRRLIAVGRDGRSATPLRLCGALHSLVLTEASPALARVYPPQELAEVELRQALSAAIAAHDETIAAFVESPPQTNEIARSAMLLPGLFEVARHTGRRLNLHEIGASAGLNLCFDRFAYDYGGNLWSDADAGVRLAPHLRGKVPNLSGDLIVTARQGCDVNPLRLEDAATRLRLRSYVWADQTERLSRLDGAIAIALNEKPPLFEKDAAVFVEETLAARRAGETFCLMHSIMWQYLDEAARSRIEGLMGEAGASATNDAPLAWLRMEPDGEADGAALDLTLWPGGETRRLGRADFHGRWLDWRVAG